MPRVLIGLTLVVLALSASYYSWRGQHAALILATVPVGQGPAAIALDAGHVFVANQYSDTVSVLDATNGRLTQTTAITQSQDALNGLHATRLAPFALTVDAWTGHAFVATVSAALSVLSTNSGNLQGIVPGRDAPTALTASSDTAHLYVVGRSAQRTSLSVFDTRRDRLLRIVSLDDPSPPARSGYGSSVAVVDERAGRVIVGSPLTEGTRTWVINTQTGTVLRTLLTGQHVTAAAFDRQTNRAFIVGGRTVTVLDTRTGAPIRHVTVGADLRAVVVDERSGHVFIADAGSGVSSPGRVIVLDGRSGIVVRIVAVGVAPEDLALDPRREHVLVVNGGAVVGTSIPNSPITITTPGSLSVLDARSASVVRTVVLGGNLGSVAVDPRADRAFIIDGGGYTSPDRWHGIPHWLRRFPLFPRQPARVATGAVTVLDLAQL